MKNEIKGVKPIKGEIISIDDLVKGKDIKEGGSLDYTTPMGLQIKAKIEKGAPTKVEFFHDGKKVEPEGLGAVEMKQLEGIHLPPHLCLKCYWVWRHKEGPMGVILWYPERVCTIKKCES